MSAPTQALLEQLAPVLEHVAALPLSGCNDAKAASSLVAQLEQAMPVEGPVFQALGETLRRGVAAGWLCDRGDPSARFCRVAKASPDTHDLSIDVVALEGSALRHRHPRGEITMAFSADPSASGSHFDDHPPGWVVLPQGSVHTPTVTGPRMLLLYFLPAGAVEWNPAE